MPFPGSDGIGTRRISDNRVCHPFNTDRRNDRSAVACGGTTLTRKAEDGNIGGVDSRSTEDGCLCKV